LPGFQRWSAAGWRSRLRECTGPGADVSRLQERPPPRAIIGSRACACLEPRWHEPVECLRGSGGDACVLVRLNGAGSKTLVATTARHQPPGSTRRHPVRRVQLPSASQAASSSPDGASPSLTLVQRSLRWAASCLSCPRGQLAFTVRPTLRAPRCSSGFADRPRSTCLSSATATCVCRPCAATPYGRQGSPRPCRWHDRAPPGCRRQEPGANTLVVDYLVENLTTGTGAELQPEAASSPWPMIGEIGTAPAPERPAAPVSPHRSERRAGRQLAAFLAALHGAGRRALTLKLPRVRVGGLVKVR